VCNEYCPFDLVQEVIKQLSTTWPSDLFLEAALIESAISSTGISIEILH
jgi:hypothetical protein